MTSLEPRSPYTHEELSRLYPRGLELQLVQVLLRHGERTPVSTRFQSAGLSPFWPYCATARRMSTTIMTSPDVASWDKLEWKRQLETFGHDDSPVASAGPGGEVDSVCTLGELTDKGRESTLALGKRLRHLYVDQLGFMPKTISNADSMYLRATPIPRALESMQHVFAGMYPASARSSPFPPPTMILRTPADETLFPNDSNCRRFSQLSRAFAQRTADRWNNTAEMDFLNTLISKWMPEGSKRVAVDSHPRLSGIMDTINSTLAHGPSTRLPKEFYNAKGRDIIDRIGTEEWFSGYKESNEYRILGVGGLLGDVVSRMADSIERGDSPGYVGGREPNPGESRDQEKVRFAMSGCHDTTLAAVLASLGTYEGEKWPPYTSHIAIELFKKADASAEGSVAPKLGHAAGQDQSQGKGIWSKIYTGLFGRAEPESVAPTVIARRPLSELDDEAVKRLDGHYVRLRYNDRPMVIPGCRANGKHLDGDESFCTLTAFKEIVDKFTPSNWKLQCLSNLDKPAIPAKSEPAGF